MFNDKLLADAVSQHLMLQLCGCLMQALIIYMEFCNKGSNNKEIERIIEKSVLFKIGSNFPLISFFHSSFGTHSVLIELQ